jgi:hypothetical protein
VLTHSAFVATVAAVVVVANFRVRNDAAVKKMRSVIFVYDVVRRIRHRSTHSLRKVTKIKASSSLLCRTIMASTKVSTRPLWHLKERGARHIAVPDQPPATNFSEYIAKNAVYSGTD